MSKLEELILKYCPDGVERIKLGDCCNLKRGSTITAKDAIEGDIPVIAGGKTPAYYHNASNRTGETITIAGSGAYAGFVAYWNKPIFVSDAFTVAPKDNGLLVKYIYYFLINIQEQIYNTKRGSGVPHVQPSSIDGFFIPLPPLPVQEEIVRILDSMVDLQNNIEAELKERKKQYEHYREQILGEQLSKLCPDRVERIKLGDLGVFENIGVDKKTVPGEPLVTLLNYVDIYHHKHILPDTPKMIVSAPDKKIIACSVKKGDIFITPSSETRDDIGHSAVIEETIPNAVYSYHIMRYRLNSFNMVQSYYINYIFDTLSVKKQILGLAQGLTRFGLSKDKFASIAIPLPPLPVQEEIVRILDSMTALQDNLEAELAERRRQYEYYRNKILSFE